VSAATRITSSIVETAGQLVLGAWCCRREQRIGDQCPPPRTRIGLLGEGLRGRVNPEIREWSDLGPKTASPV
jgi:hypothetical protein